MVSTLHTSFIYLKNMGLCYNSASLSFYDEIGTPPLLVKGRRDPFVRSEGHADSRYGIVTVGLTRLHFTLSTTRHGLESSTS